MGGGGRPGGCVEGRIYLLGFWGEIKGFLGASRGGLGEKGGVPGKAKNGVFGGAPRIIFRGGGGIFGRKGCRKQTLPENGAGFGRVQFGAGPGRRPLKFSRGGGGDNSRVCGPRRANTPGGVFGLGPAPGPRPGFGLVFVLAPPRARPRFVASVVCVWPRRVVLGKTTGICGGSPQLLCWGEPPRRGPEL